MIFRDTDGQYEDTNKWLQVGVCSSKLVIQHNRYCGQIQTAPVTCLFTRSILIIDYLDDLFST